jgi:hypothetical protein
MIFDNPIGLRIAHFIDLVLTMLSSRRRPAG